MLSNRSHKAATAFMSSQQLAPVSYAPFSTPHQLGTTGSSLPSTMTFQLPPARSYSQSGWLSQAGPQALVLLMTANNSLVRDGNSPLQICLGLCKWHFKDVSMHLESMSQWHYAKALKHFKAHFSVHVQFWCSGTGTHADVQEALMLATVSLNFPSLENVIISLACVKDSFTEHSLLS